MFVFVRGLGLYATRRKVSDYISFELIYSFSNLHDPFSRTMAEGLTQSLKKKYQKIFPEGKAQQGRKADNFSNTCEPIV
jgi:hypothetical protein